MRAQRGAPPISVPCPACDVQIDIHLADAVFADLMLGEPYDGEHLPTDANGRRALLCWACAEDGREIERSGLGFDLQLFIETTEAIAAEVRAEGFRWTFTPRLATEPPPPIEPFTPEENEAMRKADLARLFRHYTAAIEARDARALATDRAGRAAEIGLHVVKALDDDSEVPF